MLATFITIVTALLVFEAVDNAYHSTVTHKRVRRELQEKRDREFVRRIQESKR